MDTRGHLHVIGAGSRSLVEGVGKRALLLVDEGVFELAVVCAVPGGGRLGAPGG